MEPNTREMVRCEGCGELHYADECETIIIKVVKGKNCAIKSALPSRPAPHPYTASDGDLRDPNIVNVPHERTVAIPAVVADVQPVPQRPKKNIVPPHMLSMMIPQDHPNFEALGAKETRRV